MSTDRQLTLKDFHYDLPDELVAQSPLANRSASRLLLRSADGRIEHRQFSELPDLLPPNTHIIFNDTRVMPGRLLGQSVHGGRIEIMLLRPAPSHENSWIALGKPFKKLNPGTKVLFSEGCEGAVLERYEDGSQPSLLIRFNLDNEAFANWMDSEGFIPLPPYIHRKDAAAAPQSPDRDRYQTVYAQERGSVAAPTAGLHFSDELWKRLREKGLTLVPVTLHVGGGTFLPVKHELMQDHVMHRESFRVSRGSYEALRQAVERNHPIVAVGTTSLRCVESLARRIAEQGEKGLLDRWLDTDLFLYPKTAEDRIRPWAVNGLLTNFHQPESTLLMLVSALVGYQAIRETYAEAIKERYRFFSYGDASLFWLR